MCCGKKRKSKKSRQVVQTRRVSKLNDKARTTRQVQPESESAAYFQYLGKRRLTVMGPRTRKYYRFEGPDAIVAVDPRDKLALAGVTRLRQVRKAT